MRDKEFLEKLEQAKEEIDNILLNPYMLDNRRKEICLKNLEMYRYEVINSLELQDKYSVYDEDDGIDFVNKHYEVKETGEILHILIPEVLPKYKNISRFAYKNIMLNVAKGTKEFKNLFKNKLTFVIIVVHERQKNMDIDNKFVKPIIDGLVMSKVIKDDNFSNMFYLALGKNDTIKPYTDVFVLDGKYILEWILDIENKFKNVQSTENN